MVGAVGSEVWTVAAGCGVFAAFTPAAGAGGVPVGICTASGSAVGSAGGVEATCVFDVS
jgi:hypothetical protein